ncbi:phage tail protein [Burkholderia gladioli]|uniref:phage tail protein n=1 Tax=Burkholderia gladioli TaxID=28095 RepID=UPI00164013DC|nr:phage tail protein [Burkholderia gladioli]
MNAIPVYQTDRAGMYCDATMADESPLEPGVFLVPAGAIAVPPPSTWPNGTWPRWNGMAWELVTRPAIASADIALEKLRAFLATNPDVADLIGR